MVSRRLASPKTPSSSVIAQFQADAAQDKQPENDHELEIKAAEGRGVEQRKGEVERAASGQEPDFIAVPDGADAGERGLALRLSADQEEVENAHAEIESVEHNVADDHDRNQPEPDETHHDENPLGRRWRYWNPTHSAIKPRNGGTHLLDQPA
jgi:hypothetical protein